MSSDTKEIPPELAYILESCKAVAEKRYADALVLVREGLRENVAIADRIESAELITLFRTLVTVIESTAARELSMDSGNSIDSSTA